MESTQKPTSDQRRTRDGALIVPVDTLQVGDRMRLEAGTGAGRSVQYWPILEIEETPKMRTVTVGVKSTGLVICRERMRRTTLIARAPRPEETP